MATIQGTDADSEGKIKWLLTGQQYQLFGFDLAETHPTGSDLRGSMLPRLGNRLGGAINSEDVAVPEPRNAGARRGSRSATDLEYPHSGADRQRVHDFSQTWREGVHLGGVPGGGHCSGGAAESRSMWPR